MLPLPLDMICLKVLDVNGFKAVLKVIMSKLGIDMDMRPAIIIFNNKARRDASTERNSWLLVIKSESAALLWANTLPSSIDRYLRAFFHLSGIKHQA